MSIFTHPCQRPESLPLCKVSLSTFLPPYSCSVYGIKVWLENDQNQTKTSATPPFQPASMWDEMLNMSFHDFMSCHVVMSCHVIMACHVVTLETDPCVCPCQYSPTYVKDQNPCLCGKCHFQRSQPPPLPHFHSCSVENVKRMARNRPKTNRDLTRPLTLQESVSLY